MRPTIRIAAAAAAITFLFAAGPSWAAFADPPDPAGAMAYARSHDGGFEACRTNGRCPAAGCIEIAAVRQSRRDVWTAADADAKSCVTGPAGPGGVPLRADQLGFWIIMDGARLSGLGNRLLALQAAYDASKAAPVPAGKATPLPDAMGYPAGADSWESSLLNGMPATAANCLLEAGGGLKSRVDDPVGWADAAKAKAASDRCPTAVKVPAASRAFIVMMEAAKASGEPARLRFLRDAYAHKPM